MRAAFRLCFSAALLVASTAAASLTPSEEVILKQYVAGAQRQNAARVRAVVARPDLTPDESAEALSHALAATPVSDARVGFLRELLFGAGSQASRPVLAAAVTRALLARADAIFDRAPLLERPCSRRPECLGDVGPTDAGEELLRIYAFLDADVANAGTVTGTAVHDPSSGIDEATYAACAKALGEHLNRHAAALRPGSALSPVASRIRAQAMLAAFDMGEDSPTRAIDGALRLGLDPPQRQVLLERGVLFLDDGKSSSGLAAAAALVRRLPRSSLAGVEAVFFGADARPELRAHGSVLVVGGDLDGSVATMVFPRDEIAPSRVSAGLGELAIALTLPLTRKVLASRGELALAARRDVEAAGGDPKRLLGAPHDRSPEAAIAAALGMLLVDAPRTIDLAMARFLGGRPESIALVSDALGVLAASAGPSGVQSLVLGEDSGGASAPLPVSSVRLDPSGAATAFSLGRARWELVRDTSGAVTGVHQGRQPLVFSMLHDARVPVSGGAGWSGGGLSLRPMHGAPLVGVVASRGGARVRVVGRGALDVAAMTAPGNDVAFDADVTADGSWAVLLRASDARDVLGVGLRITPGQGGAPAHVALVSVARGGAERELASSTLPSVEHVRVAVRGATIHALCTHRARPPQSVTLEAPLPARLGSGDVALVVGKGSDVDLGGVSLRHD